MRSATTVLAAKMACVACVIGVAAVGCTAANTGGTADAGTPADGGADGAQPGATTFTPSNFDPTKIAMTGLGDVEGNAMSVGCDVDTDMGTIKCAEQPAMTTGYTATPVSQPGGENAVVFAMKSFKLDQGVTMNVSGSKPAIFYVLGDADIEGVINLAANGSTDGPGAFHEMGPGQGGEGAADMNGMEIAGAGGASFCGTGGKGASGSMMGGASGKTYGTPELVPLFGGSAGGTHSSSGYGGGGIQITATGSITIGAMGGINVNGDGGDDHSGIGGGGGSGGSILLESLKVTVGGTLTANGGGGGATGTPGSDGNFSVTPAPGGGMTGGAGSGGDTQNGQDGTALSADLGGGGGGAGRIRINTADGTASITGALSPSTKTPCATVGKVKM